MLGDAPDFKPCPGSRSSVLCLWLSAALHHFGSVPVETRALGAVHLSSAQFSQWMAACSIKLCLHAHVSVSVSVSVSASMKIFGSPVMDMGCPHVHVSMSVSVSVSVKVNGSM